MVKKTYSEKLKDPRWQKKRLEVLNRDEFMCQECADTDNTLHVHHITYQGSNPWDTDLKFLVTLCEDCHKSEEESFKTLSVKLITTLKNLGVTSTGIGGLIKVFENAKDRGWTSYEPMYDILETAINEDDIWDIATEKFWSDLNGRVNKGNEINFKEDF